METTWSICYRSGVQSERSAGSALTAVETELLDSGVSGTVTGTWSGGGWTYAVRPVDGCHPLDVRYFVCEVA